MAWVILLLAGLFEVGWAIALKYTEGFTRLWPSLLFGVSMTLSVSLLGYSLKFLPLGTAYAIWTGIGALGTFAAGIAFFGEAASPARIGCVLLIVAGMAGLKMTQ